MFFMRFFMLVFGISRSTSFVMDCSCIAPLTLVMIVIRGFIVHPLFRMALISGSYFVYLWERACNVWVMRCIALLWRAILRPFRYGCSPIDSKWGHVSLSFLGHSVQLGFWNLRGWNIFFLWLPMYWAYLNCSVWVNSASVTFLFFQIWLESF